MEPSLYLVLINYSSFSDHKKNTNIVEFLTISNHDEKKMSAFIFLSTINLSLKNKHVSFVSNYILFNCDD